MVGITKEIQMEESENDLILYVNIQILSVVQQLLIFRDF